MQENPIYGIKTDKEFETAALELFRFQSFACAPYREYLSLIGINPQIIGSVKDIPFMPIEFFKTHKVYCGEKEPEKIFTSSATGGQEPSRHYMFRVSDYEQAFRTAFSMFYGAPENISIYALLPSYLGRDGSSLIYMADSLIRSGGGGFYLSEYDNLIRDMSRDQNQKILLGVSYALLDLAEKHAPKLHNTIVMETGGMKGKREEMPKNKLHKILCEAFGVGDIHSEYGMAELTSQAYSYGQGIFVTPPWMRVVTRDLNDPFELLPHEKSGGINITDLANRYSCAFIQTHDIGVTHNTKAHLSAYSHGFDHSVFSISGRVDRSEIRGCNLLIQ